MHMCICLHVLLCADVCMTILECVLLPVWGVHDKCVSGRHCAHCMFSAGSCAKWKPGGAML